MNAVACAIVMGAAASLDAAVAAPTPSASRASGTTMTGRTHRIIPAKDSRRRSWRVRADLAIGTLTRLEAGTTDPSWSSVRALAEALGISPTVLGRLVEGDRR
jgi:hypothetical protein